MAIITCPCGQKLPLNESMLGKKVRCGKCQKILQIPAEVPGLKESSGPFDESGVEGELQVPPMEEPPIEAPPMEEPPAEGGAELFGQGEIVLGDDQPAAGPADSAVARKTETKAVEPKKSKNNKILVYGGAISLVLALIGGLAIWWFTRIPSTTHQPRKIQTAKTPDASPPEQPARAVEAAVPAAVPSAPLPEQEEAPPTELPPTELPSKVDVAMLESAPAELPPKAEIYDMKPAAEDDEEIADLIGDVAILHKQIFQKIEEKVDKARKQAKQKFYRTRIRAVQELIRLDHRLVLAPLQEALQDEHEQVRAVAATQLGRFGSSRVVKPLTEAMKDESPGVRTAAARALGRCGDESVFTALIGGLMDDKRGVRQASYNSLRHLSGQPFQFDPQKSGDDQPEAVSKWRLWFEDNRNKVIRGNWYRMRTPIGQRIGTLRFHGGGTLSAVDNGLQWLANCQKPEGYWDQTDFAVLDPKTEKPAIRLGRNMGLTGLALLAYLASGHTPETDGKYKEVVTNTVNWVLKNQRKDGRFYYKGSHHYSHGICTMAIAEVYGMTDNEDYKQACLKAVGYIVKKQGYEGGFSYSGPGFDTSVSGWMFMGLIAAMEAGLEVNEIALRKSQFFLRFMMRTDGRTAYSINQKTNSLSGGGLGLTALGALCRQFFSYPPTDEELQLAVGHLRKWKPNPRQLYTLYYTTLVMFQLGSEDWASWNRKFKDKLLALQVREEGVDDSKGSNEKFVKNKYPKKGSWPPYGVDYSRGHGAGGRLYSTVLSILTLQTYYRYPPIYK